MHYSVSYLLKFQFNWKVIYISLFLLLCTNHANFLKLELKTPQHRSPKYLARAYWVTLTAQFPFGRVFLLQWCGIGSLLEKCRTSVQNTIMYAWLYECNFISLFINLQLFIDLINQIEWVCKYVIRWPDIKTLHSNNNKQFSAAS